MSLIEVEPDKLKAAIENDDVARAFVESHKRRHNFLQGVMLFFTGLLIIITFVALLHIPSVVMETKSDIQKVNNEVANEAREIRDDMTTEEKFDVVEHNIEISKRLLAEKYEELGDDPRLAELKERLDRAIARFERLKQQYKD
jgi:hypothetical protein